MSGKSRFFQPEPTTNDPRRNNYNSRMRWATGGLLAVGLFGFIWGLYSRDVATSNPLVTTGRGNSADTSGSPATLTTSNIYALLRSISDDFMRK